MIKRKFSALLLAVGLLLPLFSRADEGMWLPLLIKRLNQADMQKMGLKLTAEEIYDVNNASLKDAIGQLGGFCTAEFVSRDGLLMTNHHCGYEAIQSHSSPQHDYLTDGFWAKTREQELKNPGLFVDVLVRMEDVTGKVLEGIDNNTPDAERGPKIMERMKKLAADASDNGRYHTYVRDFFAGNEFYLFVYNRFNDVRLVGAPPSSVGKFGGDTDNWMWPRHTGDFSMMRVYMAPDGSPSKEVSDKNVPYHPKKYLPVSMTGVEEGDFAMTFGFPGKTERFKTSYGLQLDVEQINPARIALRDKRLQLMKEDMDKSDDVRIKYAANYAQISNYWKYFIGQNEGIKRLKTIEGKQADEAKFQAWADADPKRKSIYGPVLTDIKGAYEGYKQTNLSNVYLTEGAFGSELLGYSFNYNQLYNQLKAGGGSATPPSTDEIKAASEEFFKNYNPATDRKVTKAVLEMYYKNVPKEQLPDFYKTVESKYKGDVGKYVDDMFNKSFMTDPKKVEAFLAKPNLKQLEADPALKTMQSIYTNYVTNISPKRAQYKAQLDKASRLYVAGLREMQPEKKFYPDANSTIRLSFGEVKAYIPRDGVEYKYYTTVDGILEKEDPKNEEFVVPQRLLDMIRKKDFGPYADKNGEMPVAFITTNDITGGNSGSPVINGRGELIGVAFDGNWEAMTGDLVYDKDLKRCINVDIRYVLWIIDKYAGAGHLVKEMDLVYNQNPKAEGAAEGGNRSEATMQQMNGTTAPALPRGTEMKIKTPDTKVKVETKKAPVKSKK